MNTVNEPDIVTPWLSVFTEDAVCANDAVFDQLDVVAKLADKA